MTDLLARLQAAMHGRYELKRELGRGGMAVVYLAEDVRHHRQVAVKVFQPELAGTVGHERFLREIQVAANLTHPHILPLYDSGEAEGLLYYVMPYIQGETLRERLRRLGQLTVHEAVRIASEVADALAYAHRQGLVHRDIKPENVMLTSGHALVMDFGICRAVGEASSDMGLTRAGFTLGTPAYMSPEQWTAPQRVAESSDQYSLGCVLYEMLVGETPFTGPTAAVMLARHTQQEVSSVRLVRPEVPGAVEDVIRKSLAKVPEARFATALEFVEALQSAITHPTIEAVPAAATTAKPSRRALRLPGSKTLLAGLGAGLVVAAAGYFAFGLVAGGGSGDDRVRLLVMPFQNLSEPERDYFADGLSEEVTSRLGSISGLAVIARTSAMQYRRTTKSVKQIRRELNIAYFIEGTVRCTCPPDKSPTSQDRLKVSVRLIDASDETPLFSQDYEVALADVFEVQTNIAQRVAAALKVNMAAPEQKRIAVTPTSNLDAYDFFLRGNSYYNRSWQRNDVETALEMYEQAVKLDQKFALAFAQLGRTRAWLYRLGYDTTVATLNAAKAAADAAVRLDSELPEAHVALGLYHYWGRWNFKEAAAEFSIARRLQPGNALVHQNIGNIGRREGNWEEAIASYREAANLDPRSHQIWFNLGETYSYIRDYESAERELQRVTVLAPDFLEGYTDQALVLLKSRGDLAGAVKMVQQSLERVSPAQWRPMRGFWLLGFGSVILERVQPAVQLKPGVFGLDSATYYLIRARQYARAGQPQRAHAASDSARVLLETARGTEAGGRWIDAALGVAYAGLGRKDEAVRSALRAAELVKTDKFDGPDMVAILGLVYTMIGDTEQAMKHVEAALSMPSRLSARVLDLDPIWEPLRSHPRYAQLLRTEERAVVEVEEPQPAER